MGALTRVLSEEYKKSVELCYNILRAFLVRTGEEGRRDGGCGESENSASGYEDAGRSTNLSPSCPPQCCRLCWSDDLCHLLTSSVSREGLFLRVILTWVSCSRKVLESTI